MDLREIKSKNSKFRRTNGEMHIYTGFIILN